MFLLILCMWAVSWAHFHIFCLWVVAWGIFFFLFPISSTYLTSFTIFIFLSIFFPVCVSFPWYLFLYLRVIASVYLSLYFGLVFSSASTFLGHIFSQANPLLKASFPLRVGRFFGHLFPCMLESFLRHLFLCMRTTPPPPQLFARSIKLREAKNNIIMI